MKSVLALLVLASISSAAALAGDLTTKTEKFTCVVDTHSKTYDATGKQMWETKYSGKSSEGTRTTWAQDGLTYRFTESLNYSFTQKSEGNWTNQPSNRVRSLSKMTKTEQDGLIVYTGDRRTVKISLKDNKVSDNTFTFQETYSLVGSQEVLVKAIHDGKEEPVWISEITENKISDNTKILVETYQVPYYSYDAANKTTSVELKNVRICTYEKVEE